MLMVVYEDRDKHEWDDAGFVSVVWQEPGRPYDDPAYHAWLKSKPDIRKTEK